MSWAALVGVELLLQHDADVRRNPSLTGGGTVDDGNLYDDRRESAICGHTLTSLRGVPVLAPRLR
ncbi:hypothetical protein [Kutzneria sp. NPDC051319]|uniref:hypothetical protein n=1 Tax=Kutzneria sp. NPDC051319 TaxID=3155047 RepID=UPI00343CE312